MKKVKFQYLIILFSFIILSSNSIIYGQCASNPNIYPFTYNGKNYEVIKEIKTWVAASVCAVQRGGYLVEINDQNEQNAVYNAIISTAGVSTTYTSVNDGGGIAYVWIGGTDKNSEGTWIWDGNNDASGINFWNGQGSAGTGNGSAAGGAYINWGGSSSGTPNEPDNYNNNQNGAAIGLAAWPAGTGGLGIAGEWNDIVLSNTLYYVIEYNTTGINYLKIENNDMCLFPNPAEDYSSISYNIIKDGFVKISLYNILGEKIKDVVSNLLHKGTYNYDLSLSSIPAGIYTCKMILNDKNVIVKKFIVSK